MAKEIYAESLLHVTVIALSSDKGPIRDFPYSRPVTWNLALDRRDSVHVRTN